MRSSLRLYVPFAGIGCGLLGLATAVLGGCGFAFDLLGPQTVSVRLINNGDFSVRAELFIGDDQEAARDVLTEFGTRMEFTIAPGEVTSFSRDCEDLQAIVIEDADLVIVGEIGPEADTDVLRDGSDFHCGSIIEFTFDHSDAIVDFDVTTTVRDN